MRTHLKTSVKTVKKTFLTAIVFCALTAALCAAEKEIPQAKEGAAKEPYVYDHRGKRDPFVPLVGVTSGKVESLEDIMSIEDVSLQGIACDSTGRKAVIINGEMVREGEGGGHLVVKRILKNEVILAIDEEEYRLNIHEIGTE